jgi:hypothetical protein
LPSIFTVRSYRLCDDPVGHLAEDDVDLGNAGPAAAPHELLGPVELAPELRLGLERPHHTH